MKNKLTLAQTLLKYSDSYIISRFNSNNIKIQVSQEYQKDLHKLAVLKKELAVKLIELRDACSDLSQDKNRQIARNFLSYFNGSDKRNAQFRGEQIQLASEIYENISVASGVDLTKYDNELSAEVFSNEIALNQNRLNYVPRVDFPKSFSMANSSSLKNGHELLISKIHSSLTGFRNTMTDDKPIIVNTAKITIKNHKQTNHDMDSDTGKTIVQNDIKTFSIGKINANTGTILSVGSPGEDLVTQKNQYLGMIAINSFNISKIQHVDPAKDNYIDKMQILNNMNNTGEISEAANLTSLTIVIDSKFTS